MTPPPIPRNVRGKKVASMQDEMDSFLAGIKSPPKSGPYGLQHVFKESEKKYKPQRVHKKDRTGKRKASRKGKSAYNVFVAKMSPVLKKKHPSKKQSELMKLIAKAWNEQKKK